VIFKQKVLEKTKVAKPEKTEDGDLFGTAVHVKVSAIPTMKVPKIKVQQSWVKPALTKDVDAPPEFVIVPLDVKCGVSIEFSTAMDFKVLNDPDLLFEVLIIPFRDERTNRSLATEDAEEESFFEYTWQINKTSDTSISIEVDFQNSYIISVGDTVHML
jgi:hypothetical protein